MKWRSNYYGVNFLQVQKSSMIGEDLHTRRELFCLVLPPVKNIRRGDELNVSEFQCITHVLLSAGSKTNGAKPHTMWRVDSLGGTVLEMDRV